VSLGLLIVTVFLKAGIATGRTKHNVDHVLGSSVQVEDENKKMDMEQNPIMKLMKSYMFWTSIIGFLVSVVLTKI
jgi:nucleoside recognition membrane protein YjiH